MKKRGISLFLCAALTATTILGVSGCSKQEQVVNTTGNSDYDEFITVDVFDTLANYQGIQSGWFAKIVKDRFNMELNIIAPNIAGGGDILFQTRSAAGNLGDLIITKTENGRLENMVKAGLLMDMTDLIQDKDVYQNYSDAIKNMNQGLDREGIFVIPSEISNQSPETSSDGIEPLVAPYVRWDGYQQIGYPEVKTLEDLIPVLKGIQEAIPLSDSGKRTYALSLFKDWDDNMMMVAKNYAALYGYQEIGFAMEKADGSDFQSIIDDDSFYVKALHFLFEANQEGLVDPESTTQNYDTLSDKFRDGQILSSIWSWQGQSNYNTREHKEAGKGMMPLYIEDMAPYSEGCYSMGNGKGVIAIGSQTKYASRLADFIDWLYSPEGMEIVGQANGAAGPEGLTWEMKDGEAVYTEYGWEALPSNDVAVPEEWGGGTWKDGISALNYKPLALVDTDPRTNEPYLTTMWSSILELNNTPVDEAWKSWAGGARTTVEFLEEKNALSVAPGTSYIQPEETSDITTLRGQCKSVIVDDSWQMVFASDEAEFEQILRHMQDTVAGLGYEEVLKVDLQNAKDRAASRTEAIREYNSRTK
ncbi:extracellular solute-binding protein [Brotaphodocola sp.]|uniref:extracellular solute-binding protein n=1 Tax=Brotaphodocola sp. TaxID=3073577 RepID=UPI003D7E32AC